VDSKVLIAKRVALELKDGNLVNLGIGLPTTVPNYLAPGVEVYFQSENGIIGLAPVPGQGMEDPSLTDAGVASWAQFLEPPA
jgi:acetate CoA/acetoacetate CoA-transferase beta subunit